MLDVRGVFTAIITPFDVRDEVDLGYVTRHLRFQERHGISGVVPCGTNGEGPSLSLHERKRLIEHVIANKGGMRVMSGTGCADLPETIELTQFAAGAGADAVLLVPPFYFKDVPLQGLSAYFRRVLDSAEIPVLLYNIPGLTGVPISDDLLDGLGDHPNLYGVKDTSGDPKHLEAYVRSFPRLRIMVGADELIQHALKVGAAGSISGLANALPELVVDVCRRSERGEDTSPAQRKVNRYKEIFNKYPGRGGSKYTLALRGFPMTYVRPPLVDLTDEQKAALRKELAEEGFPAGDVLE